MARFGAMSGIVLASLATACGNHGAESGGGALPQGSLMTRTLAGASPVFVQTPARETRLPRPPARQPTGGADGRIVEAFSANPQPLLLTTSYRSATMSRLEAPSFALNTRPRDSQAVTPDQGPLGRFQAKLAALERGERREPVTILHLGDSHVASDGFTRGIRRRLQGLYGDAGRGAVIPPDVFPYAGADQVSLSRSGAWNAFSSLKTKTGPYGVSGVRISSASAAAALVLKSDTGPFDFAEVTLVTGPSAGGVTLRAGGQSRTFSARAAEPGSKTVHLDVHGDVLTVNPAGDGTTQILYWSTGRNRPGIRYVNFGLVGATVDVTRRWDDTIVANDIKALKPDLIVYGYATNEGFDDNVDLDLYRAYASSFVAKLRREAPDADLAFVGAADGLRRNGSAGEGCAGGYRSPPKLDGIRRTVEAMARAADAHFWNWSKAMGGRCAIDTWARNGLAAKDRVHLTGKGYDRSAQAFVESLVPETGAGMAVAFRN